MNLSVIKLSVCGYRFYIINNHETQMKRCLPHFLRVLFPEKFFFDPPPLLSVSPFKNLLKLLLLFATSISDQILMTYFLFCSLLCCFIPKFFSHFWV